MDFDKTECRYVDYLGSKEKDMAEMISHSYDISDEKYIDPIVQYVEGSL